MGRILSGTEETKGNGKNDGTKHLEPTRQRVRADSTAVTAVSSDGKWTSSDDISGPALGASSRPVHWLLEARRLDRYADHTFAPSAEIWNA